MIAATGAGLLIPYALLTAGLALCLFRLGWDDRPRLVVPLAMGTAPALATWLMEVWLRLHPGPGQAAILAALIAAAALGLAAFGWRERRRLVPSGIAAWTVCGAAVALLALFWLSAGTSVMLGWDQVAYRLTADRVVAEGVADPAALILQPTHGGLNFVHAFHGFRYVGMLAFDSIFGASAVGAWDALPTVWYLTATALLLGGFIGAGEGGWGRLLPWLGAGLLLVTPDFIRWPLDGKEGAIFAAFATLALFLACSLATEPGLSPRQATVRWLAVGMVLGLSLGHHRTTFVLPLVPVCYAIAAGALTSAPVFRRALAGAAVSVLFFSPFGVETMLKVGSLAVANPVSDALVPYRETWREAFQDGPLALALVQFSSLSAGAAIWLGAALVAALFAWLAWRDPAYRPAQAPRGWALAISLAVVTILVSDMLLLWHLSGQSELILRSTRYRQMVVPMLVFVTVAGAAHLWARLAPPAPAGMVGRWRAAPLLGCALLLPAVVWTLQANRFLAGDLDGLRREAAHMFAMPEREVLAARSPSAGKLLQEHEALLGTDGFLHVDRMALAAQLDRPLKNLWLAPGVFPLLDARDPAEAHRAAEAEEIVGIVLQPWRSGMELYSATGIRHLWALEATSLVFDEPGLQLFRRRPALLEAPTVVADLLPQPAGLDDAAEPVLEIDLFEAPVAGPGDFELAFDFESKGGRLDVSVEIDGRLRHRFSLVSWRPASNGPQRARFLLQAGETATVKLRRHPPLLWQDIRAIRLRREPDPGSFVAGR